MCNSNIDYFSRDCYVMFLENRKISCNVTHMRIAHFLLLVTTVPPPPPQSSVVEYQGVYLTHSKGRD